MRTRFALVLTCTLAVAAGGQTPPRKPERPITPPVAPRAERPMKPIRPEMPDDWDLLSLKELRWNAFDDALHNLDQLKLEPMWHPGDELSFKLNAAQHEWELLPHDMPFELNKLNFELDKLSALDKLNAIDLRGPELALESSQHALALTQKALAQMDRWPELSDAREIPRKSFGFSESRRELPTVPREPWAKDDAADSLYKLAREALNRGEYRRAAQLCRDIPAKYAQSAYAPDALYWQAYALYRIGGADDLREASRALEQLRAKYKQTSNTQLGVEELNARILGALASRGDKDAAKKLKDNATTEPNQASCDKEDQAVRIEALNALSQSQPDAVLPLLRRVLARRDQCSATLRRNALFILGRRADSSSADLLTDVAKNDTDTDVKVTAIEWLARIPGDKTLATLEEIVRTSNDERMQRAAVRALAQNASPRARTGIRAMVERTDVPQNLRLEALGSFDKERSTTDDAAWLRNLYPKLDSDRMRSSVLNALARIGGPENDQFLAGVIRKSDESVDLRASALRAYGRSMAIGEMVKMYDGIGEQRLRQQLIEVYASRKEPEATDKLIEIARTGTDYQLRRNAIAALTRKNDPRTTQLLMEIINKP